jgi:hypothetical protein
MGPVYLLRAYPDNPLLTTTSWCSCTCCLAYDDWKGIDWSWLSMDGCLTKAPLGGEKPHRPRQARGQAELLVEADGIPVGLAVEGSWTMAMPPAALMAFSPRVPCAPVPERMMQMARSCRSSAREVLGDIAFSKMNKLCPLTPGSG